jgi:hypothetical protein
LLAGVACTERTAPRGLISNHGSGGQHEGGASAGGTTDSGGAPIEPGKFVDVTAQAGLFHLLGDIPENVGTLPCGGNELMAGGAAAADYDGDGHDDLFVTRLYQPNLLFHNLGDGTFEEVAAARGLDFSAASSGALWGDIDGDGDLDLFVTTMDMSGPRLFINDGGTFSDEAQARGAGLFVPPATKCAYLVGATFVDYDGDGDLDLQVAQWFRLTTGPASFTRLLANDGTGHFSDVTAASQLDPLNASAFTPAFADVDGDGDPDAWLTADFGTSALHTNAGGVFTEVTAGAGVGTDNNGMGSAIADFDDDGDVDWFVSAIWDASVPSADGNRLYLNDGSGVFSDATDDAGVREGGWGWGAAMFDYDGDGDLDIAMANGYGTYEEPINGLVDPLRLWRQESSMPMTEVSAEVGFWDDRQGRSLVPFDYDGDGDLDVFVSNMGSTPMLFRNDVANGTRWLRVRLRSGGANTFGIGATVVVRAALGGQPRHRMVHLNPGYLGHGPPEAHFGLSDHVGDVHQVVVNWPDGSTSTLSDVAPDQVLTVER